MYLGWGRESYFVCYHLLVVMWFLFREVFSSSGCFEWAALFYCGTPWAFHIIILLATHCGSYLHEPQKNLTHYIFIPSHNLLKKIAFYL